MKKLLLIIGILVLIACITFLLLAALKLSAYHNLLDGTPEHYQSLHNASIANFVVGLVLAVIGAACLIIRAKI